MAGQAWYGHLFDGPSIRRSAAVWILFGIPCVLLSRLGWLESAVWWLMLGVISLMIAAVTVRIVLWMWKGDRASSPLSALSRAEATSEPATPDTRAGPALVASTATWAIAWLLVLNTLAPEQTVARSGLDTAWSFAGLLILGIAVAAICGAVGAILGRGEDGHHGASWIWNKLTGRALVEAMPSGNGGLVLAALLSAAAITGWLWLLTQATRLAFLYAGWSR